MIACSDIHCTQKEIVHVIEIHQIHHSTRKEGSCAVTTGLVGGSKATGWVWSEHTLQTWGRGQGTRVETVGPTPHCLVLSRICWGNWLLEFHCENGWWHDSLYLKNKSLSKDADFPFKRCKPNLELWLPHLAMEGWLVPCDASQHCLKLEQGWVRPGLQTALGKCVCCFWHFCFYPHLVIFFSIVESN